MIKMRTREMLQRFCLQKYTWPINKVQRATREMREIGQA